MTGLTNTSMVTVNATSGICAIEGQEYFPVGFGTGHMKRTPELCFNAINTAADLGYRIIDTATRYMSFTPISEALKGRERHEFYIISKAWHESQTSVKLREDLTNTLQQLKIDYLDAYFLHWPNSQVPIEESLGTMEQLRSEKLIRHIGLSNVTVNHLKRALELSVPITWVQNEMSPFFYDPELLAFCQKHSITVQASAPLHESGISEDPLLSKIGEKHKKTAAQVALRWILQHGCVPLPRSVNPKHTQQNREIMDFTLSEEDMKEINGRASLGTRKVRVIGEAVKTEGFKDEFDLSYEQCWPIRNRIRSELK